MGYTLSEEEARKEKELGEARIGDTGGVISYPFLEEKPEEPEEQEEEPEEPEEQEEEKKEIDLGF